MYVLFDLILFEIELKKTIFCSKNYLSKNNNNNNNNNNNINNNNNNNNKMKK
jgi:hypothetical protein